MTNPFSPIQTGIFRSPAAVWVLACLLCSCAGLFNTIPDREEYEYKDIDSNSYRLELVKGEISCVSRIVGKEGDTLETIGWTPGGAARKTPFRKPERYFRMDTLFMGERSKREMEACGHEGRKRNFADYVTVIATSDKDVEETYRRFSRIHRFGGQVDIQITVRSSGSIEHIYLLRNTSGDHDFSLALLRIVNGLKFPPIESSCRETIRIPYSFRP